MRSVLKNKQFGYFFYILTLIGAILSLYLTINYFSSSGLSYCLTGSGCDLVKDSKYSSILGIPLPILGLIGYIAIFFTPFTQLTKKQKWTLLFIFSSSGFAFSLYLTYLEFFVIRSICSYCIASAILITFIFFCVLNKRSSMAPKLSMGKVLTLGLFLSAVVIVGSYSIHAVTTEIQVSTSSDYQIQLAKHLRRVGAVMYGSFKCPHCNQQKTLFGGAFKYVYYVECHNRGENANPSLCFAKGIRHYPTWEIKGRFLQGKKSLEELSELSGFKLEQKTP